MVERLSVEEDVAGSSPVSHPTNTNSGHCVDKVCIYLVWRDGRYLFFSNPDSVKYDARHLVSFAGCGVGHQ